MSQRVLRCSSRQLQENEKPPAAFRLLGVFVFKRELFKAGHVFIIHIAVFRPKGAAFGNVDSAGCPAGLFP